jgi:hypothetical protein
MDPTETVERLRGLRDEPIGPPTTDLAAAITTGRRRIRRRRAMRAAITLVTVGAAIVAVPLSIGAVHGDAHTPITPAGPTGTPSAGATPTPSAAATASSLVCTEQRLPTPHPNQEAITMGADPTGRYHVGRVYGHGGSPSQVAVWHDGVVTAVTMPGGDGDLTAVNSRGVAIGASISASTLRHTGWVYDGGRLTRMSGPDDFVPIAIDDDGVVVGSATGGNDTVTPLRWSTPTSAPQPLPLPPGRSGWADAIGEDGTIIGNISPLTGGNGARAVVWHPGGSYELLPMPTALVPGVSDLSAYGIHGSVVDVLATVRTARAVLSTPLRYDLATGTYTRLFATGQVQVNDVNAAGWAVGAGAEGAPSVYAPAYGVVRLPTLVRHPADTVMLDVIPWTISDDGRTVGGQDTDAAGVIRAVIWTCDPS